MVAFNVMRHILDIWNLHAMHRARKFASINTTYGSLWKFLTKKIVFNTLFIAVCVARIQQAAVSLSHTHHDREFRFLLLFFPHIQRSLLAVQFLYYFIVVYMPRRRFSRRNYEEKSSRRKQNHENGCLYGGEQKKIKINP